MFRHLFYAMMLCSLPVLSAEHFTSSFTFFPTGAKANIEHGKVWFHSKTSQDGRSLVIFTTHSHDGKINLRLSTPATEGTEARVWMDLFDLRPGTRNAYPLSADLLDALREGRVQLSLEGQPNVGARLQPSNDTALQFVSITNNSKSQVLSPPVVISHGERYRLFQTLTPASQGLGLLAEEGDPAVLLDELAATAEVYDVSVAPKALAPGHTVTVPVMVSPLGKVTVAGMVVGTNDGFYVANAVQGPGLRLKNQSLATQSYLAAVYDAGTEANTEDCTDIPGGPCQGAGTRVTDGAEGIVRFHDGIRGDRDLDRGTYGWAGPVAEVTIGRDVAGMFEIDMGLDINTPDEIVILEPEICEGSATSRIYYSRADNEVVIEVDYVGIPHNLSLQFDSDPSTPYHRFPIEVSEGRWQTWIVGYFGGKAVTVYYDGQTREILGTDYDLPDGPPPGSISFPASAGHAVCSPLWDADENGNASVRFTFAYDGMLDARGTGGMLIVALNYTLGQNTTLGPWLVAPLPAEDAFTFDDMLANHDFRNGFAIATSYEPAVKPDYLLSRANTMTTWLGPSRTIGEEPFIPDPCQTRRNPPWPFQQKK